MKRNRGELFRGFPSLIDDSADVDEVIGNNAESGPADHSFAALVPATVESVPPLEYADASFASCSPLLPFFEPAFLLLPL